MITSVKMAVTPELSEKVQEVVFMNGGKWCSGKIEIHNTKAKYLYIYEDKLLGFGNDDNSFNEDSGKEVSAYAFIATDGMESWLPKYNEVALFKCGNEFIKAEFIKYNTRSEYPFITTSGAFQECLKIPNVSFTGFLEDNEILNQYMENIQVQNQRWSNISSYIEPSEICEIEPRSWLYRAFKWSESPEGGIFWGKIDAKWSKYLDENPDIKWSME